MGVLELCPQNCDVSSHISKVIKMYIRNMYVGYIAIEEMRALKHSFVGNQVCIVFPTFSSCYEFVREERDLFLSGLRKEMILYYNLKHLLNFYPIARLIARW